MPLWQIIAAAIVVFAIFLIARRLFNGEDRIREVDHREPARPDLGEAGFTLDSLDPGVRRDVLEYLRNNQKINAIKELRTATGLGLKESKDIIDEIHAKMNG